MGKSVKFFILICSICVATFIGIFAYFYISDAHDKFSKDIVIESSGKTIENFSIDNLSLTPGTKKEYSINLYCKAEGKYKVIVDYIEKEDGGLKDHVNVEVKVGDRVIMIEKLSNLLQDDFLITFSQELFSKDPAVLTLTYEMSKSVGNEAKNTSADFDIKIEIEKE